MPFRRGRRGHASERPPNGRRLCIVLLARSEGDWWKHLAEDKQAARLLGGAQASPPLPLPPFGNPTVARRQLCATALRAFRDRRNRRQIVIVKEPAGQGGESVESAR